MRVILDAIKSGIIIFDIDHTKIIFANKAAFRILQSELDH